MKKSTNPKKPLLERPFDSASKRQEGEIFKSFIDENRITLEVARLKRVGMISEHLLSGNMDIEVFRDEFSKSLFVGLVANIATKKFESRTIIYPANWWESLKKRWAPKWLLSRYPAKHEQVTFEASAYYPDIAIPGHAAYVDIVTRVKNRMYS